MDPRGARPAPTRIVAEFRSSLRRLARRPVFTVSAVTLVGGTLAIAVTAGSVAEQTLLAPMPYADEAGLVALYWSREDLGIPDMSFSLVVARELTDRTSAFTGVAATQTPVQTTLLTDEGPTHLTAGLAMPDAFGVLGVQPLIGRAFTPAEGEDGASGNPVVLSYRAWQRLFAGDRDALGASLVIDQTERRVVGVLPPGRSLAPEQALPIDVWFPMGVASEFMGGDIFSAPAAQSFRVNARLREGVDFRTLRAELPRLGEAIGRDYPETDGGWQLNADPLRDRVFGRASGPVTALFLGSVLFCALAISNLAGLLYHRADEDARDVAIRRALGASESRIRLLRASDAIVIGTLGAALACALAYWGLQVLSSTRLLLLPDHVALAFGWPQLLVVLASSLFGTLAVAWLVSRVRDSLHDGGLAAAGRRAGRPSRARAAVVMLGAQVALSTALTVGAVAALRSLDELRGMDVGISPEGLATARVDVPRDFESVESVARGARDLVGRVRELPAVSQAFVWSPELPTDAHTFTAIVLEGADVGNERDPVLARYHSVSAGAIGALGLRFIAGRDMTDDDWVAGRRVAVVSASAAQRWWGSSEAAVGRRMRRTSHTEWSEVVGVVDDAALSGRFGPGTDNTLDAFFMFDQDPRRTFLLFVRGPRDRVDLGGVRAAAASVMPDVPLYDSRWMTDRLTDQERGHRSTATFGALYAMASLLLASVGLAGTALIFVDRRRWEVAIRQALGATRRLAVYQLLRGSVLAVLAGILVGVVLARFGLGFVHPVILRVGPGDAISQLIAALTLGTCAAVSLTVPSFLRVRRDPARALNTRGG